MLSRQTEHRLDVSILLFAILQEVLTGKEEFENDTRITDDDAAMYEPAIQGLFNDIDVPDVIRPTQCGGKGCCGWHQTCAQNLLDWMREDIKNYYEDDGSLNTEFLRKLMSNVFEEVAIHRNVTPTTIWDSCTRGFNGISLDDFFNLFIRSFESPNPLKVAIENDRAGSETVADIDAYIRSLGYSCVENWYYR